MKVEDLCTYYKQYDLTTLVTLVILRISKHIDELITFTTRALVYDQLASTGYNLMSVTT